MNWIALTVEDQLVAQEGLGLGFGGALGSFLLIWGVDRTGKIGGKGADSYAAASASAPAFVRLLPIPDLMPSPAVATEAEVEAEVNPPPEEPRRLDDNCAAAAAAADCPLESVSRSITSWGIANRIRGVDTIEGRERGEGKGRHTGRLRGLPREDLSHIAHGWRWCGAVIEKSLLFPFG